MTDLEQLRTAHPHLTGPLTTPDGWYAVQPRVFVKPDGTGGWWAFTEPTEGRRKLGSAAHMEALLGMLSGWGVKRSDIHVYE